MKPAYPLALKRRRLAAGLIYVKQPFATYIEQQYGTTKNSNDDAIEVAVSQQQGTKRLIEESTNVAIWRIPGSAWLFRAQGNGQYTALVDVLEFKNGGAPVEHTMTVDKNEWVEEDIQPVGVMYQ